MLEVIASRLGDLGLKLSGKQNPPPPIPVRDRVKENRIKTEELRFKSTEARLRACEVRLSALEGPPFQCELDAVKDRAQDRSLTQRVLALEDERFKQAYEAGVLKEKCGETRE